MAIYGRKDHSDFTSRGYGPEPTSSAPMGPVEPADIEPASQEDLPQDVGDPYNEDEDEDGYDYEYGRQNKKKAAIIVAAVILVIVLVLVVVLFLVLRPKGTPKPTIPSATTAVSATTETAAGTTENTTEATHPLTQIDAIKNDMRENGGGGIGVQYVMGNDVDPKLDISTTGEGAFNPKGIRTPEAMVSWLKEKTPKGKISIAETQAKTEASENQIFEVSNWFVLQALVDGKLTGNTGFVDGNLVSLGERDIKAGDIFLVFVNPDNLKMIYFRGACANPQGFTPQLNPPPAATPTPTTTKAPTPSVTLAPKDPSKDSAAKGNAPVGSGVNQDPGPGNYVAPTAAPTPPVESRVNPTPPAPTVPTAAPTAATTAAPATTPTPTPVDVAVGDPTSVGTPAIPN